MQRKNQEINSFRQSWAVGVSLLLHSLVLLGLGIGTLPGSDPGSEPLVVYLAMPSTVPERALVTAATSVSNTVHKTVSPKPIQPLQVKTMEAALKPPAEIVVPEKNFVPEPEQLAETEPRSKLSVENFDAYTKPETIVVTSNIESLYGSDNGAGEAVDTVHESRITAHQFSAGELPTLHSQTLVVNSQFSILNSQSASALLAFAGDPVTLGMIVPDTLGPDLVEAEILSLPEPDYPVLSRKRGEEGRVVIELEISARGKVLKAEVANSSSYPRLDRAALEAVKAAIFGPAIEYGRPVESVTKVAYRFELKGQ